MFRGFSKWKESQPLTHVLTLSLHGHLTSEFVSVVRRCHLNLCNINYTMRTFVSPMQIYQHPDRQTDKTTETNLLKITHTKIDICVLTSHVIENIFCLSLSMLKNSNMIVYNVLWLFSFMLTTLSSFAYSWWSFLPLLLCSFLSFFHSCSSDSLCASLLYLPCCEIAKSRILICIILCGTSTFPRTQHRPPLLSIPTVLATILPFGKWHSYHWL